MTIDSNIPIDPIAISTTIARTYGFSPALAIPVALPVGYPSFVDHPGAVSPVSSVSAIARARDYTGSLFDEYA